MKVTKDTNMEYEQVKTFGPANRFWILAKVQWQASVLNFNKFILNIQTTKTFISSQAVQLEKLYHLPNY